MPENPSNEDAFTDLFAKLPDPKQRDAIIAADPVTAPTPTSETAPISRRAAREAAMSAAPTGPAAAAAPARDAAAAPISAPVAPQPAPAREEPVLVGAAASAQATSSRSAPPVGAGAPPSALGLDDLFAAETTPSGAKVAKKKRRRVGGWIALGIVLLLIGGAVTGGVWVWNTYESKIRQVMGWEAPKDFAEGEANGEAVVTVISGDTGLSISKTLYDAGVTKTPQAFYDHLVATGQNPNFVPGAFKLQKQMTSTAALTALMDPANKLENSALIREGLTVEQIVPILAESLNIDPQEIRAAVSNPSAYGVSADSLEGWLFPAMYTFNPGVTATQVIQTMVDRTVQSLDAASVLVADRERILTIASIIQREARFEADFYKVSRVIENRLNPDNQETFGLLQMDSTAQYGFGENDGTVSTSTDAQNDDNPWNTYVHPGLPIGPISNPGDVAIDAAMHPADGNWLYFVTVNLDTGETVFTDNLNDHNAAVQQWRSWCSAHPDSGC